VSPTAAETRSIRAVDCPPLCRLRLQHEPGRRFLINRDGFATLVAAPAECAYGLVWTLDEADESNLDRYENVAAGEYRKETVMLAEFGAALIYIAADATPGRPVPGYLEGILAAAAAAGLPHAYQAELARWRAA
jgi:hypothetical protein